MKQKTLCLVCGNWDPSIDWLEYEWILCSEKCKQEWHETAERYMKNNPHYYEKDGKKIIL